jgi:hypothetical protein
MSFLGDTLNINFNLKKIIYYTSQHSQTHSIFYGLNLISEITLVIFVNDWLMTKFLVRFLVLVTVPAIQILSIPGQLLVLSSMIYRYSRFLLGLLPSNTNDRIRQ